jgi:hypothetical protein
VGMGFSDIPTDNMYKFAALFGLAGFIFIMVFLDPKRIEIDVDKERLKGKMEELEYKKKHIERLSPAERNAKECEFGLIQIRLNTTLEKFQFVIVKYN